MGLFLHGNRVPLTIRCHHSLLLSCDNAQKASRQERDNRGGRFLLTKVELLQFYLVLHMLHDNIDMLSAQQLAKIYALQKDSMALQIVRVNFSHILRPLVCQSVIPLQLCGIHISLL